MSSTLLLVTPPPPANSFVIGPAVINTHRVGNCLLNSLRLSINRRREFSSQIRRKTRRGEGTGLCAGAWSRDRCFWYFGSCLSAVTVALSGPRKLFKGVTTATSGVLARFPWLLPVRNSFVSYGASAVARTSDRGHVAEVKKPDSS